MSWGYACLHVYRVVEVKDAKGNAEAVVSNDQQQSREGGTVEPSEDGGEDEVVEEEKEGELEEGAGGASNGEDTQAELRERSRCRERSTFWQCHCCIIVAMISSMR
jgi:hypothetical protein